jgi:hypothetical protein
MEAQGEDESYLLLIHDFGNWCGEWSASWLGRALPPGTKRSRGVTLTTHPHLMSRSRMSSSYTFSPSKRLHGVWRDSFTLLLPSVSIVSDYGLDDRAIEVQSLAGAEDISSSLCVQTGSGAHPASCPIVTRGPTWRRPDDGGSTHLWNIGQLQRDYTALHSRSL